MGRVESRRAAFCGIEDVRLETVPMEAPRNGDLLLRNKRSFLCATDLKIIRKGYFRIKEGERRVLGHELAGVVAMAGPSVEAFREGDSVLLAPNLGCGNCDLCREGNDHLCRQYEAIGITLDGGFADYTLVPERFVRSGNVIRIPHGYSFDEAALIEPLACCLNGLERLRPVPGDRALIMGAGPIGAFHALLMKALGVHRVFICDLLGERVEKLSFLPGVERFCNKDLDLPGYSLEITGERLFDIVITANAAPECQQIALKVAGVHGRVNFFGGLAGDVKEVGLETNQIHYKELTVVGSTRCKVTHFHQVIRLLGESGMKGYLAHWVSAKHPLSRFKEAYEAAAKPANLRVGFSLD